jgi:hydrogenase maturation protease
MESVRTVVIGLGNELLGDDAFGLAVVRMLSEVGAESANIVEAAEHGLGLLDHLEGYGRAIIVDALIGSEPDRKSVV